MFRNPESSKTELLEEHVHTALDVGLVVVGAFPSRA
jgi:hypothetical protein